MFRDCYRYVSVHRLADYVIHGVAATYRKYIIAKFRTKEGDSNGRTS